MERASAFVDSELLSRVRVGRDYVAAKYGFRNHWYPVCFSREIAEGAVQTARLCGEPLLLRRIEGVLHAIRDRCIHRGVPLSRKIECFTDDTITCWYHGFTYRFRDGVLCDIVGARKSALIGKRRLRTYPVEEAKGLVFVFLGDEERTPPPLAEDVPPGFLDEGLAVRGRRLEVNANWRVGAENGFDNTHIFIHRDSTLIEDADLCLPLGLIPKGRESFARQEEEGGPKGVFDFFNPDTVEPVFDGTIEGVEVTRGATSGKNILPHDISIWLPCALRVKPWPAPDLVQFEWYVPIDGSRHIYLQTLAKQVSSSAEEAQFDRDFEERWIDAALIGFNQDDVWAREATEPFYADDRGWVEEQLFEADANIIEWRRLASQHHRGIQSPEHLR